MLDNHPHKKWSEMTTDEKVASVDVTQDVFQWPKEMMSADVMLAIGDKLDAFRNSLDPKDPRHRTMLRFDNDGGFDIFWGGYAYPYHMSRIQRPEDLIWFIHHLSKKEWPYATLKRVGILFEKIARSRGWPMYGFARHPNEAPKTNHDKIKERGKMTAKVRYEVIKRDAYRCRACGFSVQDGAHLHVDHIVAIANGGETVKPNLQTLCTVCNLGKGTS